MKRYILLSVLLLGASCITPPHPVPPPTPPPAVNEFPNLVLKAQGTQLVYPDGKPFEFREAIWCCEGVQNTGWPNCNRLCIDESRRLGRATLVHYRIGPFASWNEPEDAVLGGGYAEVNNLADLNTWNQKYWDSVVGDCRYANSLGTVCEVVPVDDWVLKTEVYGGSKLARLHKRALGVARPYPWRADANVQHEDATSQAPGPRQEAWLRKVVHEFGRLGVVWQLGNEEAQNVGYNYQAVTVARAKIIRDQEAKDGYLPHLMSQNSGKDVSFEDPTTQWTILHNYFPGSDFNSTKPVSTNEYNYDVATAPEEVLAMWCRGKKYGPYVAAWRNMQGEAAWTATLGLISQGVCTASQSEGCSIDPPPVGKIGCKHFSGALWDCTPKDAGGQPIRVEGAIDRAACEALACGTPGHDTCVPSFRLVGGTGTLQISQRPGNPVQFTVQGSGTGTVECTTPASGAGNICRAGTGGPLVVAQ